MGTVRVKEGNQWGTISVKNVTAPWMGSATIRIAHDDVAQVRTPIHIPHIGVSTWMSA